MAKERDLSGQNEGRKGEIVPSVATPSVGQGLELFAQKDALALTSTKGGRAATVGMLRDVFLVGSPMGKADPITGKRGLDFFMEACSSTGIGMNDQSVRETLIDFGVDVLAKSSGLDSEYYLDSEKLAYLKEIFLNSGEDPDVTGERFAEEGSKRLSKIREGLVKYQEGSLKSKSHTIIFRGVRVLNEEYIPGVFRPLTAIEIFNSVDKLPSSDDVLESAETAFALLEIEKNEDLARAFANIALSFAVHLYEHVDGYSNQEKHTADEIQERTAAVIRHFAQKYAKQGNRQGAVKYSGIIGETIPEEEISVKVRLEKPLEKILDMGRQSSDIEHIFNDLFEASEPDREEDGSNLYVLRSHLPADAAEQIIKYLRHIGEMGLYIPKFGHLSQYDIKYAFTAMIIAKELEDSQGQPVRKPFWYTREKQGTHNISKFHMDELTPELARSLVDEKKLIHCANGLLKAEPLKGDDEDNKFIGNINAALFFYKAAGSLPPAELVVQVMHRLRTSMTEPVGRYVLEYAWQMEKYEAFRLKAVDAFRELANLWSASTHQALSAGASLELESGGQGEIDQ